ncbi:MAG: hypothetical protein ACREUF_06185 [Solimonas sp.]
MPLLTLLLFLLAVFVVWKLVATGESYLSRFAALLTEPAITRGPFSFLSGRSYAAGKFQDRKVAIRLQLKRSRYGQGYLVVALETDGVPALDYGGIELRARDEAGRRALHFIAKHDLVLSVEDGWLKALWQPQGFVIFPGGFSEEKWREVLDALQRLANSLEGAGPEITAESAEGS